MTDRPINVLLLALAMLGAALVYTATAIAAVADAGVALAPAAAIDVDPLGWARAVYDAVRGGQWAIVAGLALVGVTYAVRRWLLGRWAWAQTDRGGVVLAGALALAGALGNAALAGAWPDGRTLLAALEVAMVAMGGYAGLRKLLWPAPKATPPPVPEPS